MSVAMPNITVGRYADRMDACGMRGNTMAPTSDGYLGWIEPDDRSWIVFVRGDHTAEVYLDRDPETGAVLDSPREG